MRCCVPLVVAGFALLGCARLGSPEPPIAPGVSTPLRIGETRLVAGTRTAVHVVDVVEDSRCPSGVQCVWQGRVRIAFRLGEHEATLETDSSVVANGLVVRLDSVIPHPASTARIAVPHYRAFVTVVDDVGLSPPSR